MARKNNLVLPRGFIAARELFRTARFPDNGKPLAKNRRLVARNDRGEGYGIRYHRTVVVTFYADSMLQVHVDGYTTMSTTQVVNEVLDYSYEKVGQYLCLTDNRRGHPEVVYSLQPSLLFTPDAKVLVPERPTAMWDGRAQEWDATTGKWYKMHVLVRAPVMRPLSKSRDFRYQPIAGDVFVYKEASYIWTAKEGSLVAWPYHGDSTYKGYRIVERDDKPLPWDLAYPEYAVVYGTADIERKERYVVQKMEVP